LFKGLMFMKAADKEPAGQMRVVVTSQGENVDQLDQWDRFLDQCPHAHIEQSSAWVQLKQLFGWTPTWIWTATDDEICGGTVIFTRRVSAFASIAFVERGPIWRPGDGNTMTALVRAIHEFAASRHVAYLVVAPPYIGSEAVSLLESLQFRPKPNAFPPSGLGRATLLIDLSQDLNALLAGMSMTKRQNIRRAIKKGVKVRVGGEADAEIMRDLMWTSCRRRGIVPVPSRRDYFDQLWRTLGTAAQMKFFVAEVDGQPVAAATTFLSGDRMELWRVGWSGTHEDFNPNDFLHWEMMNWGKENGCRYFDFLHIEPEHARAILRGERVQDAYWGVTEFKTGFGGQIRLLPDLYYRTYYPVAGVAFDLGAARIVESAPFQHAVNRVSSKLMKWTAN
jgi:lipid II:glycine glycyltransferase (peptidoglycan interpeptide bridge formation enzyme)